MKISKERVTLWLQIYIVEEYNSGTEKQASLYKLL